MDKKLFNKKASSGLVLFVFGCTLIIIVLLYVVEKSQKVADAINTKEQSRFTLLDK